MKCKRYRDILSALSGGDLFTTIGCIMWPFLFWEYRTELVVLSITRAVTAAWEPMSYSNTLLISPISVPWPVCLFAAAFVHRPLYLSLCSALQSKPQKLICSLSTMSLDGITYANKSLILKKIQLCCRWGCWSTKHCIYLSAMPRWFTIENTGFIFGGNELLMF